MMPTPRRPNYAGHPQHAPPPSAFGPATLKAMGEAFDQAWNEIVGNFGDTPWGRGRETAAGRSMLSSPLTEHRRRGSQIWRSASHGRGQPLSHSTARTGNFADTAHVW